jgi:P2 family phage major capsid protein
MNLSTAARKELDQLFFNTAQAFGVPVVDPKVGQNYAATPSVAQTIYDKVVLDGNAFLQQINVIPVSDIKGEKVGLSLTGRVARRTNTANSERTPNALANTDAHTYECFKTEFDVALKYSQIDSWAKFKDFADRYMKAVRRAIANDILQTGWTGTSAAAATNIVTNPLLQDLNIGWLQLIRAFNGGSQYVTGTELAPIQLGGTDFNNLDVLAHAARQKLAPEYRHSPDLVVLLGSDIQAYQEETYYELNGNKPSEKALLGGQITKGYAGMPSMSPPFIPDGTLVVTPLSNFSVYYQDTSVRRLQKDKPEKDEVQEFNTVNLGYVVEEETAAALIDNITLA